MKEKYSSIAKELLQQRYLKANESPSDMFRRVASWVSQAETESKDFWNEQFYQLMDSHDFLPNSPCLMNAGTSSPQLAACFVYPIEDDLESIFDTLKLAALTHKSGGGTGFSFSRLRPKGYKVGAIGDTSGPLSFMEVYDKATDAIKQGGKRRGANMAVLRSDHPDIEEFVNIKRNADKMNNFNLSVALTDDFIKSLKTEEDYNLQFPAGHVLEKTISAKKLFEEISYGAWHSGEPGVIFIDKINKYNPVISLGPIEALNPCGEQPLLPYEACILGSVNLGNHIVNGDIDWEHLKTSVQTGVRFLDDAIDMSDFPAKAIHDIVKANRKIGLGIMGFASMLIKMEIPYASVEAIKTARKVMSFITQIGHEASEALAVEKGEFPNFYKSNGIRSRRNALVTTIAPTGSISLIAGTSSGIEPMYALVADRVADNCGSHRMVEPLFEELLDKYKLDKQKIIEFVSEYGSIQNYESVPINLKKIFLTATEIEPRIHVMMQAAFQRFVDNAISKTVNLPEDFSQDKVKNIIYKAYSLGCKGITVYRQKSRKQQVLNIVCECES